MSISFSIPTNLGILGTLTVGGTATVASTLILSSGAVTVSTMTLSGGLVTNSGSIAAGSGTDLTLTGGSSGASLVLGEGSSVGTATLSAGFSARDVVLRPTTTGHVLIHPTGNNPPILDFVKNGAVKWEIYSDASDVLTLRSATAGGGAGANYQTIHPTTGAVTFAGTGTHLFSGSLGLAYAGTQKWYMTADASNNLVFTRSGIADRMTLSSDGKLEIGGVQSAALLNVTGDNSTRAIYAQGGASFPAASSLMRLDAAGATAFQVLGSGLTTIASTTASTGVGTGALQVAGGIYAGAASVFGAGVTVNGPSGVNALAAGTQLATFESSVNGAAVELITKGKNSVGTARQANMGINRFADDVWSLSNGTTEYLRVSLTAGAATFAGSVTTTGAGGFSATGATGAAFTATGGTARIDLANTTPSTGKTWILQSYSNGTFYLSQNGSGVDAIALTGAGTATFGGVTVLKNYTVATLPAAASYTYGEAYVSDATQAAGTSIGSAPTGGGSVVRGVYSNGSAWLLR